jgi:hypothetical protein
MSFQRQIPNFAIDKIYFGIETSEKKTFSNTQLQLVEQAENNLKQFYPAEKNEAKLIEKKLKKISLKNLLPSSRLRKLNSVDENTIIFHGELKKLINFEINVSKPQMYSNRFCILYPKCFKYYKSKEQFLKSLKPLCVIPLNQITKVNFAKIKKNQKGIDHIIICNKLGIVSIENNNNSNENNKEIEKMFGNEFENESKESLIIFKNGKDDNNNYDINNDFMYKWYVLFQYFVEKNKENENKN